MVDSISQPQAASQSPPRGRGRGKSRGGLGKYLRARGRGRGRGRPAEFGRRLVLEDEQQLELDEEEQRQLERELQEKYGRRQLDSNADRYAEPEPELGSDGEEIVEPEVDLSAFLERQKLSDLPGPSSVASHPDEDEDPDIDKSLAHMRSHANPGSQSKKGRVQQIEWDAELEELSREKAAAEATRDLKTRFRAAQTAKQRGRAAPRGIANQGRNKAVVEAPPLPSDTPQPAKSEKETMQGFLDDLLR
ncbi:hypothetical protein C8Q74DRAFT_1211425 [Fomes fomentarius]|nr:hypothetical protein C8Q74DRAFT_1211425 [Fomes fomentarius]